MSCHSHLVLYLLNLDLIGLILCVFGAIIGIIYATKAFPQFIIRISNNITKFSKTLFIIHTILYFILILIVYPTLTIIPIFHGFNLAYQIFEGNQLKQIKQSLIPNEHSSVTKQCFIIKIYYID